MKPRIQFRPDKDLILAILTGIAGGLVALAMFFLSGYMVTQSALGAPLYALIVLVVSVKLFGFLRAFARYGERLLSHRTTFTMLRDVRVQFLKHLIPRVPNIYRKYKSSDLISKMISKVEALQNIYLRVYYPPIVIGFTAMIAAVTLIYFSVAHAIIIVISMLCSLWIVPWLSAKRARTLKQQVALQQQDTLAKFYDYKEGYEELNCFNQTEAYRQAVLTSMHQYDTLQAKETRFLTLYDYMLNILAMLALFASLALGAIQVGNGQLNVIYLTSIVLMMLTLFEQAVPMSNFAYYKADTDEALEDLNGVLSYPTTTSTSDITSRDGNVFEVKDLTFNYLYQETPVLNKINLTVNKGEKVAIIGPSGSGKSTLLQILSGLYEIPHGDVRLYSQTVTDITEDARYSELNVLLQAQQLFDGTIRENLFSEEKDETLLQVLEQVNLGHLKLDQQLTLDGHTLSGGEIQRLAFARLLLKKADVWILDEPTTALDEANTQNVMRLVEQYSETMVVATHDIELLSRFDKIVVMIDGQVIEQGSYEALVEKDSYFSRLMKENA
ncbi:thiol reductant ABC exporter subunit CydC [Staphylococcus pragensis]|uniref:Thiol reductant ABC exporter subunit CydC n=1 Tax=Staphylococcus pragensis TaxID=1611836 RepID=A0A4Z1BQT5_9STAP|nr:thiol reductant ABC exporter subunit CydC [Staphylococcus pragensis]RTX90567.1 thiol reductant ABC exporter subunit CydC [Staphylococcus carnosus]TGN28140.1 thiol reductant ABC exporter subunit CydC [Staphylococcus pragensis]GGG89776.1 cysteine ABC transporter ATP-binding protein [Staphylococcus pragensis]